MTDDTIALRALLEKGSDASVLREMIGFAAHRLMELETEARAGPRTASAAQTARCSATAIATGTGKPGGHALASHPQAAQRIILSVFPRTPAHSGEGPHRRDPRGLRPGRLDAQRGRPGSGHGRVGHQQERGQPLVRRVGRARGSVPQPAHRRRLALPVAGRHLRQSPTRPPHHVSGRHRRGRRQHRWQARGAGHGNRQLGGRDVLDRVPALLDPPRAARGQAGGLRRPRRAESRREPRAGATAQRCRVHFMRNAMAHAGKSQRRVVSAWIGTAFAQDNTKAARQQWRAVADQLRPRVSKLAELMDSAEGDVLAYMDFPAAHRTKLHSTTRSAAQRRDQATRKRRRPTPERSSHCQTRRRPAPGA